MKGDSADGRPHLVPVPEPAEPAAAADAAAPASGGQRLAWLLAVLAVICALGWGLARRDAAQLERELGATQTALAEVSATLRALESQRQEARSQLQTLAADASALAERLTGLEALLATDPAPAADAQETRSPDDAPR